MAEKVKKTQQKSGFIPFEKQNVIVPLKMMIVVVRQNQRDAIIKILNDYQCSFQISTYGYGESFIRPVRELNQEKKVFIFTVVREDVCELLGQRLEQRFAVSVASKGIAYTIDLTSVAGVSIYKFLSNTRKVEKVTKNGKKK